MAELSNLTNLIELSRIIKQPTITAPQQEESLLSRDRLDPPELQLVAHHQALPSPIKHARGIAVACLSRCLSSMFNALDDTLFELSDRAHHAEEQTLYLDSMRLLRAKRWQISDQFKNRLNNLFDGLIYPDASPLMPEQQPEQQQEVAQVFSASIDADALSIVVRMVKDARQHLAKPLIDIQQRLDGLVPCRVAQNNNPLDPQQVCDAFLGITAALMNLDKKTNCLVLGQFYRHVIAHLPQIIKQVNQIFSSLGVMPCQLALDQYDLLPLESAPDKTIQQGILHHKITGVLTQRLADYSAVLPKIAVELFQGPWLQVMVKVAQEFGLVSAQWDDLCEFTDQILASLFSDYALYHRIAWLKSLSPIVQGLLSYLHQAGLSAQDIDYYLLGFEEAHRQLLDVLVIHEAQSSTSPLNSTVVQGSANLVAADVLKPFMRRVQRLQLGCWVEFTTLQGQVVRCKLADKHSSTHQFLFVDKRGNKVLEQAPVAVAQALREGLLTIVESKPLFDRAAGYISRRAASSFSNR